MTSLLCITPGCDTLAEFADTTGVLPSGELQHVTTPPFPHQVNDPGPAGQPASAVELAQLREVVDALVDAQLGGPQ